MPGPKGPLESRLDDWLAGTREEELSVASGVWRRASSALNRVADSLEHASLKASTLGGHTGPKAAGAFESSAVTMRHKSGQLAEGAAALLQSSQEVYTVRANRAQMGEPDPRPNPSGSDGVANPTPQQIQQQARDAHALSAWQTEQERRERRAQQLSTDMNDSFLRSAETMKKIHGEPDPAPRGPDHDGGGGDNVHRGPGPGPGGGSAPPGGTRGPGVTGGGQPTTSGPTSSGVASQGGSSEAGTSGSGWPGGGHVDDWLAPGSAQAGAGPGGIAPVEGASGSPTFGATGTPPSAASSATGGGLTGGLLGSLANSTGGPRAGLAPMSTSSAATGRSIGSTSRTGAPSTLGRGTTPPAAGSTSRGVAGSRGTPGSRTTGSAAGAGGRGSGKQKDRSVKRDHYDTADWDVEDDEAAPGLLN